jgi:orotate phosphoribosyltransferase
MNETAFARFLISSGAIRFGNFRLKSGLTSDTFFDFGNICRGKDALEMGAYYADFIIEHKLHSVDAIFGPAYKGISIALATSMALFTKHGVDLPYIYNRKTAKAHGEQGILIGYPIEKISSVLVVDDVITDGGTKYETIALLSAYPHLKIKSMVVGIDREQCAEDGTPFIVQFKRKTGIDVYAMTKRSVVKGLNP